MKAHQMQHQTIKATPQKTAIAKAIGTAAQKPLAPLPDFDTLPGSAFVKQPQILELVPISASSLWRWVRDGMFPRPIKLSEHCSVWRVQDVRAWMAAQTAEV
jgi:prophage regulatory protein